MIKRIKHEKYKVYEYSNHAELVLHKERHTHTFIFFAGFNEFASKYIYLFKSFFEKLEDIKIKIVIPYLPSYNHKDEEVQNMINNGRFTTINSWLYRKVDEKGEFTVHTNEEIRAHIINLITKEIKEIGAEKIIFGAFSQGGLYLSKFILDSLKIKTCFNVIFKSPIVFYQNSVKENDKQFLFNSNHFHLFYSRLDKVVSFDMAVNSYRKFKSQFNNVFVKYDNSNHHVVDYACLEYLEELILSYLKDKELTRF